MPQWSSGDWACPRCRAMQFRQNMSCRECGHPKPTVRTMGQAAFQYYPLAAHRSKCEGERNCEDCHGVIHQSHGECMACRERRLQQTGVVSTYGSGPWNSRQAARALPAPQQRAVASGPAQPKTTFDALCDAYRDMSPEDVLKDLARLQDEQKHVAEAKAKQEAEAKTRAEAQAKTEEKARLKAEKRELKEQKKAELAEARSQASIVDEERLCKRDAAADLIQAMLDKDDDVAQADRGAVVAVAAAHGDSSSSSSAPPKEGSAAAGAPGAGKGQQQLDDSEDVVQVQGRLPPPVASVVEDDDDDVKVKLLDGGDCLPSAGSSQTATGVKRSLDTPVVDDSEEREKRRRQRERRLQRNTVVLLDD